MLIKILVAVIAVLGLILFVLGLRRLWRRKLFTGSVQGLTGLLLLTAAALAGAIALNLYTYQRLTYETPVAEVRFQSLSPSRFRASLTPTNKNVLVFELYGDAWQLDARVLKWHGMALLLGLDPMYRLDRLSGRYSDVAQERTGPRTVYDLSEDPGLDIWTVVRLYEGWIPWVDAIYGSATYMPMADGARYTVTMTASGLMARATNEIAQKALQDWR